MNKLPRILVAFAILLGVSFYEPCAHAQEASITGDGTIQSLAQNHAVPKVREAIEAVNKGDYAKAMPVLQEFAKKDDVGATYVLGRLHNYGLGVEASIEKATELFMANAESGHTPSMMALAAIKQSSKPAEAIYFVKQAASAGDVAAMVQLGSIYETGKLGVTENPKQAFNYFKEASELGNPFGDYHLARCYDLGIGVSANEVQSTRLYRKAAFGGVVDANSIMAKRYFEGKGLEADPIAAIGWLTRGAQNGSAEAMVVLGERYAKGDTLKQDINRAGQLFSQAAKMGNPTGTYKLGMMFLNGTGTKSDPVRAYVLLSGAPTHPEAQQQLQSLKRFLTPDQLKSAQEQVAKIATEQTAGKSGK